MLRYQYHLAVTGVITRHGSDVEQILTILKEGNTLYRHVKMLMYDHILRVCHPLLSKLRGKYIHINQSFALLGEDTYYQTLLTCLVITKVETGSRSWEQWLDRTRGDTSTSHQPPVTSRAADDPLVSQLVFRIQSQRRPQLGPSPG